MASSKIYIYNIPFLPDHTHYRLRTLFGGDVKSHLFKAFEHFLRIITNFEENQISFVIRFIFDPEIKKTIQDRLKIELGVKIDSIISENTVNQLIDAGPLSEFYDLKPLNIQPVSKYKLESDFPYISEIIKYENKFEPLVSQEVRDIDARFPKHYYSICPFEPNENNDYKLMDVLLAKVKNPCVIELVAQPINHTIELETHYKYLTQLMAINQFRENLIEGENIFDDSSEEYRGEIPKIHLNDNRDPLADEIAFEQQEIQRNLREPQLLFNIKVFTLSQEESIIISSTIAESGFINGKYNILTSNIFDNPTTIKKYKNDSEHILPSTHVMYDNVWGNELPVQWNNLRRLCRIATVNELKGIIRLPIGGYGALRCIKKTTDPKQRKLEGKVRLFFPKNVSPDIQNLKFITKDNSIKFVPKNTQCLLRETEYDSNTNTIDIDIISPSAPIKKIIYPNQIKIDSKGKTNNISVANQNRFGGSILVGSDLETANKIDHKYSYDNLLHEFQSVSNQNLDILLPLDLFSKHIFVAGVPGSGKTTDIFNILVQLYMHGIPFLVIEPAKTEYRIIKSLLNHPDPMVRQLATEIRVYTPGNDEISPFRFNPLFFPKGITVDSHIGQIISCFEAGMPMSGPLQGLLAESIEEVYKNFDYSNFPKMLDLFETAKIIMENKKYVGDVKSNLQAAVEVRLGLLTRRSIGKIFQVNKNIPSIEDLLNYPTIIEMDYLSQNNACLLTLFLLSSMREHIKTDGKRLSGSLSHVTVIEEAHNIVGKTNVSASPSESNADPKAFAAQYVSKMLAELRALGEGLIIADQLPSAVAPEVIKNTGTKIAHRLVAKEDREDIGHSMLLGSTEIEEIARFSPGEAYFYNENFYKPRRIQCLNSNDYLMLSEIPDQYKLKRLLTESEWYCSNENNLHSELRQLLSQSLDLGRIKYINFRKTKSNLMQNSHSDKKYLLNMRNTLIDQIKATISTIDYLFDQVYRSLSNNKSNFSDALRSIISRWKNNLYIDFVNLIAELNKIGCI